MKGLEKLRVLLPHWIDHNTGHEEEFLKWVEVAREEGQKEVADYIAAAVEKMQETSALLEKALEKSGGPAPDHQHHHH